jgi:PAS domain S-box-containing protein
VNDDRDAQESLRRIAKHLAAAQRITHCGSWELDLADLGDLDANPLRWSDEVFRIFGYEPGEIEVTNANFFRAVHPDDREAIAHAVRSAIELGTPYSMDHRVIRPDGSVRIVHEQSQIQYDSAGKPLRMIGTVQDVTEQRTTEAQLVFADRLSSIGAMAAGVAHEINNPLAAVLANLDLIARGLAAGRGIDELRERVADASEGAERVRAIVKDLMVFARAEDRRRPVDVTTVLESALRMVSHDLRYRARLVRDYGEVPPVLGNEARLGQVFLNLLRNAIQAFRDDDVDRHEIRIATSLDARGRVIIAIADNGSGIPPELQSRVFTPFFTTKPQGVGTGLGLSICHRIITDLGGEITFGSLVGQGTEFRIAVPTSVQPSASGRIPRVTERRYRVLIVDDEPMITAALERILADHEVTVYNAAYPAVEAIAHGARYDAILCDLMMPQMTGIDLHAELARIAPDQAAKTIVMTGGTFAPDVREKLGLSGVPQIDKPFDVERLRELVARAAATS